MPVLQEVCVAAPAQVANIFGYFDCAGLVCSSPPLSEASRIGGIGDIVSVQFAEGQLKPITVEYLVRSCDAEGVWGDIEPFSELALHVRTNSERDIIQQVARKTVDAIVQLRPDLTEKAQVPLSVTVVKCLPAGKVGVGLGSSASSTSVAIAIDRLFGDVLRNKEEQDRAVHGLETHLRLKLMAEGERLVSGAVFFDNVAPLLMGGLVFISEKHDELQIDSLAWPRDLHLVTVTPDFSLETRHMREVMLGRSVNIFEVSKEIRRKTEVMLGLSQGDAERIIRSCTQSVVEDVRWPLIKNSDLLIRHIEERRRTGFNVSLGISGSGPTIYSLCDSRALANQIGEELHHIWREAGIASWWFVQEYNPDGAYVFQSR